MTLASYRHKLTPPTGRARRCRES